MCFWFSLSLSTHFNRANELHGTPDLKVNNDELRDFVEGDLSQTTEELEV